MSPAPDAGDRIGAEAYEALYLYGPDGVLFTIPDGRVIAANPAAREILQMPEDEICALGRVGLADVSDERWAPLVAERDLNGFAHGVARMVRGDGRAIEVEMSARVFRDVDGDLRTCTVIRDVTERVEMEQRMTEMAAELRDLAVQDDLTGLHNRRGFVEMATQVLELADRQGVACHLLFLDVDNMKELNDRFGHAAGDAGLRAVASTLKGLLRRADLVARLGGDEFVALTVGFDDAPARRHRGPGPRPSGLPAHRVARRPAGGSVRRVGAPRPGAPFGDRGHAGRGRPAHVPRQGRQARDSPHAARRAVTRRCSHPGHAASA